ncbi:hypothetical protein GS504_03465 [Rhodococcus hoagii]|nr:hypothetical protein [Prescottella equi]NKS56615.1 hypothetical protein [Prescottella equi]
MTSAFADDHRGAAELPAGPRIPGATMPPASECASIWNGPVERDELTPARPLVWFLGASGGCGVSSLTRSLAYAGDCQRSWPGYIGQMPGADSPLVVIVCRTTMQSVQRAHHLLLQHAAGGTPVGTEILGVVMVADIDRRLSTPVKNRAAVVESLAGAAWHVPWLEPWRATPPHELPEWSPSSVLPTDKKAARDPTQVPLPPVIDLHDQIRAAAAARVKEISSHTK